MASAVILPREEKTMAVATELLDSVKACLRQVERRQNGVWVTVPLGDDGDDPSGSTISDALYSGLLRRSGSGAGRGLKVDGEVAAAMGMPEFDDS